MGSKHIQIPENVVEIVLRTWNQADFTQQDLAAMFDWWNTTFPYDAQKITCKGCRTRVVSKLRYYVQQQGGN